MPILLLRYFCQFYSIFFNQFYLPFELVFTNFAYSSFLLLFTNLIYSVSLSHSISIHGYLDPSLLLATYKVGHPDINASDRRHRCSPKTVGRQRQRRAALGVAHRADAPAGFHRPVARRLPVQAAVAGVLAVVVDAFRLLAEYQVDLAPVSVVLAPSSRGLSRRPSSGNPRQLLPRAFQENTQELPVKWRQDRLETSQTLAMKCMVCLQLAEMARFPSSTANRIAAAASEFKWPWPPPIIILLAWLRTLLDCSFCICCANP